ncbi:NLR family CARD domain-containing protein 3-like [Salminus brasiliensis]|uniref:NLR family CARD domain-containing protein 3-like n=1 Tax=Salminus brasiliensis TaxID=930266 RepID=UPI003B8334B1
MSIPDHLLATLEELSTEDFRKLKWNLRQGGEGFSKIPISTLEHADRCGTVDVMVKTYGHSKAVDVTLTILKKIYQNQLAEELRSKIPKGSADSPDSTHDSKRQTESQKLKTKLKRKYATLTEGTGAKRRRVNLNDVYTNLYAVKDWTGGVSTEHEVVHSEAESWRCSGEETSVLLRNLFQSESKVLTVGIAGVGKTVAVQKFVLDWAEGDYNQDVDFVFYIPFRELNLITDEERSFKELLLYFHPELQHLKDTGIFDDQCRALFIFDGLDEFRVPLNFRQKIVSDVEEKAKIDVLITNLVKGHLLPTALIWITSRPATADQIPLDSIDLVTELRGFSDSQKLEYFKKRLPDKKAGRLIDHVKECRSLHIMCHMPIFCWMMTAVLQRHLERKESKEIPRTLTEMYTNFLLVQANLKIDKYDESCERDTGKLLKSNKDVILQLAELAFKQLVEGNVVFYKEDLQDCRINTSKRSVYSGICSEFLLEESFLYQRKVYCFVHLSFQEFLAAVFVFHCYVSKNMKPLHIFQKWSEDVSLDELLLKVVETSLWSQTGRYDLFLRFLLGISLESNQRLLQGLLTHVERSAESISTTVQFIKQQIQSEDLPTDRSINLFLCLLEMDDWSFYSESREFLRSAKRSEEKLKTARCSAIAYALQMSGDVLDEFDPNKYNASVEGCRRLIPAVGNCRTALLACCGLTEHCCDGLASVLQKVNSPLRELDLTNNDLRDSGVQLLSAALESPHCKLEILRLSACMVTGKGCSSLAAALSSGHSTLRELDLSYNHPGEAGTRALSDLQEDHSCRLEKVYMDHGGELRIKPGLQKYAFDLTLDGNTANSHLCLSEGNRKALWVGERQDYPYHPDRFDQLPQVVCVESVSERCYWEVECSEGATVAVTYRGVDRKAGADGMFGHNAASWSLTRACGCYVLRHSDLSTEVPASDPQSSGVGVYLDWSAGTLMFYSVSSTTHTLSHIHTFHCRFTEPLYPGFRVDGGSSITLVHIQ